MNTVATSLVKLEVGQLVQVQVTDFSPAGFAAGMPQIWVTAVVEAIKVQDNKLRDVKLAYGDSFRWELIGPRGGNPKVRLLEVAA